MRTNDTCTVYNKYTQTGSEVYQRAAVGLVAWEDRKASNALASGGQIAADQAAIFIPYAQCANYLEPPTWLALVTKTGKWTLRPGDVIVRGTVTDELSSSFTLTALKAKYNNVLVITSVDNYRSGSLSLWHMKVGAK